MTSKRFTRGTAASSREESLSDGLNLINKRYAGGLNLFPGVHFLVDEDEGIPFMAQASALDEGYFQKILPVVIDFNLTEANFNILQGRLWIGKPLKPITSFKTIDSLRLPSEVIVNLQNITHEDLAELNPKIGFIQKDYGFEYKSYIEWSILLGVSAPTREQLTQLEGKPYYLTK